MTQDAKPGKNQHVLTTEIIRSPALYLGELEVTEDTGSRGKALSGTRIKGVFFPMFYWAARHVPRVIALAPLYLLLGLFRVLYVWPANPLRQSCEYICQLARARGHSHRPWQVYNRLLNNFQAILNNYFLLYRHGAAGVEDLIDIRPADAERIEQLRQEHGGVIFNIPHNVGSAFSGLKLNRTWPTVLVARNPSTVARTRIALEFFERMEVQILMVRSGNPFELSRAMFSILKSNRIVAATLDNMAGGENRVEARIFNQSVGFLPWAAKIAVKMQVPMLPVYFRSEGKRIYAEFGEPLITRSVEEAVQHYVSFFEQWYCTDPASWAYLGDRRWRRVLRSACRQDASDG